MARLGSSVSAKALAIAVAFWAAPSPARTFPGASLAVRPAERPIHVGLGVRNEDARCEVGTFVNDLPRERCFSNSVNALSDPDDRIATQAPIPRDFGQHAAFGSRSVSHRDAGANFRR